MTYPRVQPMVIIKQLVPSFASTCRIIPVVFPLMGERSITSLPVFNRFLGPIYSSYLIILGIPGDNPSYRTIATIYFTQKINLMVSELPWLEYPRCSHGSWIEPQVLCHLTSPWHRGRTRPAAEEQMSPFLPLQPGGSDAEIAVRSIPWPNVTQSAPKTGDLWLCKTCVYHRVHKNI